MLEALTLRTGRIVSKAELEQLVLGFASELSSNALEVHVSALRRKLGRALVETEVAWAQRRGRPAPSRLDVGAMIEAPSLIWHLDALLPMTDFVSVGTNDLMQYLFAADRGNPRVADRYDPLSPPALRALKTIQTACADSGTPVYSQSFDGVVAPGATVDSEVGGSVVEVAADGSVGMGVTPRKMSKTGCDRAEFRISTLMAPTIFPSASGV